MDEHPNFAAVYRGGSSCDAVTSDKTEKISIKGVAPELIEHAIAKLSAPRKNSTTMSLRPRMKRL